MRYRPFGATGSTISNLTYSIGIDAISRGPEAASEMIYAALESGINSYWLESADSVLAEVVGQALSSVDRKLLSISLVLGLSDNRNASRDFTAEGLTNAIDRVLHVSGLGWIDVAVLEEPAEQELPQTTLNALKALRSSGRIRYLGVIGEAPVMDAYVSTGAFDVLATSFNIDSPWQVHSRVRTAKAQDMVIMAYDYFPDRVATPRKAASTNQPKKGLFGLGFGGRSKDNPLADAGTFAFLHRTANWDAESICLAHVMTDPAISSVLIKPSSPARLTELAQIPERDMPPGLSAQIEMARVGNGADKGR